jgi:hypothetical protein
MFAVPPHPAASAVATSAAVRSSFAVMRDAAADLGKWTARSAFAGSTVEEVYQVVCGKRLLYRSARLEHLSLCRGSFQPAPQIDQ